jgi:putative DNA primase/helicase
MTHSGPPLRGGPVEVSEKKFCEATSEYSPPRLPASPIQIDTASLRAALGGEISGGQVLCPGPGHSRRDRSLSVKPTANGVLVFSHAGDDWRECRDYVYQRLGLPSCSPGWQPRLTVKWAEPAPEQWRTERPKAIWAEGQDPRGTVAEAYLAARKLHLPSELCGSVLRFHPACPWRDDESDQVAFTPCMLAAFRSIKDDRITAITRIRLDKPERWPKVQRRMLGVVAGSAIKLDPAGERLAVAEGVESALAARQLGFSPVWALGSAKSFAPVDGVERLVILGEHDEPSRKAANACSELWIENGREVLFALPASGFGDFNDLAMGAC